MSPNLVKLSLATKRDGVIINLSHLGSKLQVLILCKLWNVESVTGKRGTFYILYGRDNVSARLSCCNLSILVQPASVISIYTPRSMKGMCT